jgi:hypothetical protein
VLAAKRHDEEVEAREICKPLKLGSHLERKQINRDRGIRIAKEVLRLQVRILHRVARKPVANEGAEHVAAKNEMLARFVCYDVLVAGEPRETERQELISVGKRPLERGEW